MFARMEDGIRLWEVPGHDEKRYVDVCMYQKKVRGCVHVCWKRPNCMCNVLTWIPFPSLYGKWKSFPEGTVHDRKRYVYTVCMLKMLMLARMQAGRLSVKYRPRQRKVLVCMYVCMYTPGSMYAWMYFSVRWPEWKLESSFSGSHLPWPKKGTGIGMYVRCSTAVSWVYFPGEGYSKGCIVHVYVL